MQKFNEYWRAQQLADSLRVKFDKIYNERIREAYTLMQRVIGHKPAGPIPHYSHWDVSRRGLDGDWLICLYGNDFPGCNYGPEHLVGISSIVVDWDSWKLRQESRIEEIRFELRDKDLKAQNKIDESEYLTYKRLQKKFGEDETR